MEARTARRTANFLSDPGLRGTLHQLRRTDNLTNLLYLVRTYLFFALVIGGSVWFYGWQAEAGISFWWNIPVTLVAIVLVGAGQHQLAGLGHEGAHYSLFRNRRLNELLSDWFCMFPLLSTTYFYRLQHLAHHRFTNDPKDDPDVAQLTESGHRLQFPIEKSKLLRTFFKWLSPIRLVRFSLARGIRASTGGGQNPYQRRDQKPTMLPMNLATLSPALQVGLLTALLIYGDTILLSALPLVLWLATLVALTVLPRRMFEVSRLRPVISVRLTLLMRSTVSHGVLILLAWITHLTGRWALGYFFLLWIVPLLTSFGFFMMLRQVVQHGNADGGSLTSTRTFLMNSLVRFAVFPIGQDYHLSHHLLPSIPHYRLKQLHKTLLDYPDYRDQGAVVEGYFLPRRRAAENPTGLNVLSRTHRDGVREG